jgi:hypothetical protein
MNITPPIIHLNGTRAFDLLHDYAAADDAFFKFVEAWGQIGFNARDYYPKGPEHFVAARDHREEISRRIAEIREYLTAHLIAISDQRK